MNRTTAQPTRQHAADLSAAPGWSTLWLATMTLAQRELVRFLRQRTRIVGALGQPLIFWVLFGTGLGATLRMPTEIGGGLSYQEYFLPGIAVLILLFTAIFATISIIEDRREGFLQGVLVAPIPRLAIVLGKVCGGTVLAVAQAMLFLLIAPALKFIGLAPTIQWGPSWATLLATAAYMTLIAVSLTALGFAMAWPMDSTQGFHALMSVVLLPLWLLSGAFFPVPASGWLAVVMRLNPLTYGLSGLRQVMYPAGIGFQRMGSLWQCTLATVGFAAACLIVCLFETKQRQARNVR